MGRSVPPGAADGSSLYFEAFNRGKRSIALDLTNPAGREVFSQLVATADAVFNNLRGDLPERLGLTYAALGEVNPAIVCVSLSAYGREGPRRAEPGYDALVQAEAGWASLTGEPDGPARSQWFADGRLRCRTGCRVRIARGGARCATHGART